MLPLKAPENNHRGDARSGQDKMMKATQQNILHCLRVQAHLYQWLVEEADLGEMKSLMQQSWVMMLEF